MLIEVRIVREEISNKLTYQLNPLIEAQKDFDVMETRLFYLGLQDVNPHLTANDKYYDEQFPDTVITPSQLIEIFGHGQYIKEVDKATDRLIGRFISIRFEDGFEKYTIFQHIKYKENKGLFIKFNEDMRPFLLDIYKAYKKYGFTKIEMQQIFVLGSTYAMRLLELLLQYRGMSKNGIIERELGIDELRYKLNVPEDAYKGRIGNFKQKVLDLPIEDINKHTRYYVRYETIKKGRSVAGFKFICNCNGVRADDDFTSTIEAEEIKEIAAPSATPASEEKLDNKHQELIIKMVGYGFSLKLINELTDVCGGLDELARRLDFAEKRAKKDQEKGKAIRSISGYIRRGIEENWLQAKINEERAQERELKAVKTNAEWELWARREFSNEPVPDVPERLFNENNEMEKVIINVIKGDIKARRMTPTSERLLREQGLTVARFIELYI